MPIIRLDSTQDAELLAGFFKEHGYDFDEYISTKTDWSPAERRLVIQFIL